VVNKDVGSRKHLATQEGSGMMPDATVDIAQYLRILKRRKKYLVISALAMLCLTVLVALLLPSIYESSSTILIEEQQIPPEFVKSTVTGFADQRIQSLTQQILSRVKLWEIIQQFNLYADLREKLTREEILEKMRENIKIETISAQVAADQRKHRAGNQPEVTIAFSIAYRGKNPDMVQKVSGMLASLYLEQNLKTREAQAQSTTKFLEGELKELQERIKVLGEKISVFKGRHEGLLPEQQVFNREQAARLEMDLKQLEAASRSAYDRKIYIEGQLATVKPDTPLIGATGERVMAPADRLKALEVAMADLQAKFSDDHPDVRKVRREIAELKKIAGRTGGNAAIRRQKLTQLQAALAEKQGKYSDQHPEVKKLKNEIARLEPAPATVSPPRPVTEPENPAYISLSTQIKGAEADIASLRSQQAGLQDKLQMYRQRLEAAPKVEQEYLALTRDYHNATLKHQEVMNKILEARISEGMEERQKGERFTLIDPASYPEKPVSPKRWFIFFAGVIMSLGAGFGTVALVEHLDHSVQSGDELARLTGLPVLGSIIRIQTREDISRARRKRKMIWTVTGVSLVIGLALFHFFYLDLWILTARLLRLADKYS
jgi:succinoglycan biosynthesis transport protein ExoP